MFGTSLCVPDKFKAAAFAVVSVMQAVVLVTCVAVEALVSLGACVAVLVGCGSVCVAAVPDAALDAVADFSKGAWMPVSVVAPLSIAVAVALFAVSSRRSLPPSALVCSACFVIYLLCASAMEQFVWWRWHPVADFVCWTSAGGFVVSLAALGWKAAAELQPSVAGFDARVAEHQVEVRFVAVCAVARGLWHAMRGVWHAAKLGVRVAWRGGVMAQRGARAACESVRDAERVWSQWASSAEVPCGYSEPQRGSDDADDERPSSFTLGATMEETMYRVRKWIREHDERDANVVSQLRQHRAPPRHREQRWGRPQQHQQQHQQPQQQPQSTFWERPEQPQPHQRRQQQWQQHQQSPAQPQQQQQQPQQQQPTAQPRPRPAQPAASPAVGGLRAGDSDHVWTAPAQPGQPPQAQPPSTPPPRREQDRGVGDVLLEALGRALPAWAYPPAEGCSPVVCTCEQRHCGGCGPFKDLLSSFGAEATLNRVLVEEPVRLGAPGLDAFSVGTEDLASGYIDQAPLEVLCAAACAQTTRRAAKHGGPVHFISSRVFHRGNSDGPVPRSIPPTARCVVLAHVGQRHWALYVLPGDGSVCYVDLLLGRPVDHDPLLNLLQWRPDAGVRRLACAGQRGDDCGVHVASHVLDATGVAQAPLLAPPRVSRRSLIAYAGAIRDALVSAEDEAGWALRAQRAARQVAVAVAGVVRRNDGGDDRRGATHGNKGQRVHFVDLETAAEARGRVQLRKSGARHDDDAAFAAAPERRSGMRAGGLSSGAATQEELDRDDEDNVRDA